MSISITSENITTDCHSCTGCCGENIFIMVIGTMINLSSKPKFD